MTLKFIKNALMATSAVFLLSASFQVHAWGNDDFSRDRDGERRDRTRTEVIYAEGIGGTSSGDRDLACRNAEARAEDDLYMQCSRPGQEIVDKVYSRCECSKKAGSRDDYTCRQRVKGVCETYQRFRDIVSIYKEGSGGTSSGDKTAACGLAEERAQEEARFDCSRRRGDVVDYTFGSCRCEKKSGSRDDYTCRTTVNLSCELQ